jgi:hypothetical protein
LTFSLNSLLIADALSPLPPSLPLPPLYREKETQKRQKEGSDSAKVFNPEIEEIPKVYGDTSFPKINISYSMHP